MKRTTPSHLVRRNLVKRWIVLGLFVIFMAATCLILGRWQLARLDERRDNNSVTVSHQNSTIVPAEEIFNRPITDSDEWQRVVATGEFEAADQLIVRFRSGVNRAPGIEVLTPLRTESGLTILIDRGLLQIDRRNQIPSAAPAPPAGKVTVIGYVRRNEKANIEAITPVDHQVRMIDSEAIEKTLSYPLADGYISLLEITPPQSGNLQILQPPELSDGPHFWYAVQWFMFGSIALSGLVVFIRSDLKERSKMRAKQAARAAAKTQNETTLRKEEVDHGSTISQ